MLLGIQQIYIYIYDNLDVDFIELYIYSWYCISKPWNVYRSNSSYFFYYTVLLFGKDGFFLIS
jgi:hypothetical protein